ncbi:MAG: type transport system permease protein [Thermoleophilaceae bacterium]|nr:type transport system permease protein [Thermoleophilaceae bacterium]
MSQLDTSALGRPIKGPSALGTDLRRLGHLSVTLAILEFKLRFFGSVLGYLWQLMRPLLLFGVLYVVFTQFVRIGGDVRFYPAILLTGIVLFTFFSDATSRSVTSVSDRENLVRKIEFPRLVVPLAVLLVAYFNLVLNLIAVLVFVLATGVEPRVEWLALPLLLLPLGLFAGGLAMLLSAPFVRFRDVQPIWEVVLQVLFYASPILYVLDVLPDEFRHPVVWLNPLATILVQSRHSLIDETAPNSWDAAGGMVYLLIPGAIVLGVLVLGFWVFNREAPRIAEEL